MISISKNLDRSHNNGTRSDSPPCGTCADTLDSEIHRNPNRAIARKMLVSASDKKATSLIRPAAAHRHSERSDRRLASRRRAIPSRGLQPHACGTSRAAQEPSLLVELRCGEEHREADERTNAREVQVGYSCPGTYCAAQTALGAPSRLRAELPHATTQYSTSDLPCCRHASQTRLPSWQNGAIWRATAALNAP